MCEQCGCGGRGVSIELERSLLAANDAQAARNRAHIEAMGAVAVNLMSSPGSGKTTLLERTIDVLGTEVPLAVIEGDIETDRDAARIRKKGVPVVQLTTGGACHLDAPLVHLGLHRLEEGFQGQRPRLLFIENVGNLVCPAAFALGEHARVVLLSVPEGSDKPAKYPRAFLGADAFVITKTDLLPHFDFSMEEALHSALSLNPALECMALSATTGEGFGAWISYLRSLLA